MRDREYIKNKIKEIIINLSKEDRDKLKSKYLDDVEKGNRC